MNVIVKQNTVMNALCVVLLLIANTVYAGDKQFLTIEQLVATDGIRTYHIRFYENQGKMYGARDIDNGNVFFEIVGR